MAKAKFRRWVLTEPAFIAATLLAAGSIITSDDLGTGKSKEGKAEPVAPPSTAIEIDDKGNPVSEADNHALDALVNAGPAPAELIAPISPGAGAVGAPAQAPGGVQLAANALEAPSTLAVNRRGGSAATAEAAALAATEAAEKNKG